MNLLHPDDEALACPLCENTYLHQGPVEIYERGEDAEVVCQYKIDRGRGYGVYHLPSKESNNPSSRRQGLRLYFMCELCSQNPEKEYDIPLVIYQHKGKTYVEWEVSQ